MYAGDLRPDRLRWVGNPLDDLVRNSTEGDVALQPHSGRRPLSHIASGLRVHEGQSDRSGHWRVLVSDLSYSHHGRIFFRTSAAFMGRHAVAYSFDHGIGTAGLFCRAAT